MITAAELDLTYITEVSGGTETSDTTSDDEIDEEGPGAFGQLVLPEGHKKMVLSLISQHFRSKSSQKYKDERVDIVRGKGKGLIILLHGAPGVGKTTTTAEGVAERFKKPLFQITCGDLGSDAKDVETALQTNFSLANKWDCILLLDEADVFLAERRRDDFTRNGLVAVFLRVLEYYGGILFLTTNRIGDFDEAFTSRIHVSLYYPPLNQSSTMKVFSLNLGLIKERYGEKGRKIKIDEVEIMNAAVEYFQNHPKARWNGRQIRNACQTALALAEFDAQPKGHKYDLKPVESTTRVHLTAANLQIVSKAYLDFIEYLEMVHGVDADTYAKESGLRALEEVIATLMSGKRTEGKSAGQETGKKENPLHSFKLKSPSQGPPNMATAPQAAQTDHLRQQYREAPNTPPRPGQYYYDENPVAPHQRESGLRSGMTSGGYYPDDNYLQPQPGNYQSPTPRQPPQTHGQSQFAPQHHGSYDEPHSSLTTAGSSQHPPTLNFSMTGGDPRVRAGNIPLQEQDTQRHQWTDNDPGTDYRR